MAIQLHLKGVSTLKFPVRCCQSTLAQSFWNITWGYVHNEIRNPVLVAWMGDSTLGNKSKSIKGRKRIYLKVTVPFIKNN